MKQIQQYKQLYIVSYRIYSPWTDTWRT